MSEPAVRTGVTTKTVAALLVLLALPASAQENADPGAAAAPDPAAVDASHEDLARVGPRAYLAVASNMIKNFN